MKEVTEKGWDKRRFGGKQYKFYDSYKTRSEAQDEATRLRDKGKCVRITPPRSKYLPCWELWVRPR